MERDTARIDAIQDTLREEKLDVLVCSLPANVLLLTGYWPVVGTAVAVVTRNRHTVLLTPEDERDLATQSWADDLRTFQPGSLADLRRAEDAVREPLGQIATALGFTRPRIGYEFGGVFEPASYASLHLYGGAIVDLLGEAFTGAKLIPADVRLALLRSVKTPYELDRIRSACHVAAEAFGQASALRVDETEVEAATRFRSALATAGLATSGVGRADGFAFCMSGPNAAQARGAYARSRQRWLRSGETVLVHCNSYVDGYWTNITRTYCLGAADERLQGMYDAVLAARAAALEAIRPGVVASTVDQAARALLKSRSFGDAFKHSTGHGVGFGAIDHSARPRLHPHSPDALREGMVFNVEPAVYFAGFGGLRHCDMVAVSPKGAEVLTPFQATTADLVRPS